MTNLETQIKKMIVPYLDKEYYLERLRAQPADEWFLPSNGGDHQDFQICRSLHDFHIIEQKVIPIWVDNSFRGVRFYFRYNEDMKYAND